jgi:putative polyketide hydroxylase
MTALAKRMRESHGPPGARAPHLFLNKNGKEISTLDLFGRNFVLIAARDGQAWCDAARGAARELAVPLDVYHVGAADLRDMSSPFPAAYGISESGAVLVRPDGFVGWRARDASQTSAATVEHALSTLSAATALSSVRMYYLGRLTKYLLC